MEKPLEVDKFYKAEARGEIYIHFCTEKLCWGVVATKETTGNSSSCYIRKTGKLFNKGGNKDYWDRFDIIRKLDR